MTPDEQQWVRTLFHGDDETPLALPADTAPEPATMAPIIHGQGNAPKPRPKYDNETRALLDAISAPHLRSL